MLVKTDNRFEEKLKDITTVTGEVVTLYQDIISSPEWAARIHGEVVSPPASLNRQGKYYKNATIDVQEGDKIYFHYGTYLDPAKNIYWEGERYYLVDYWDVLARVRDGVLSVVGDWVLMEEVERKRKLSTVILNAYSPEPSVGIVRFVGTPYDASVLRTADGELQPGDTVLYRTYEGEVFKNQIEGVWYACCRSEDIYCKVDEETIEATSQPGGEPTQGVLEAS